MFNTIKEMDKAIESWIQANQEELTPIKIEAIRLIAGHACKFIGHAWFGYEYAAEKLKRSQRTVIRIFTWLESNGFMKIEHRRDKKGKWISNRYTILAHVRPRMSHGDVTRTDAPNAYSPKGSEAVLEKDTFIHTKNFVKRVLNLDSSFVPDHIPKEFVREIVLFFSRAADIYKLWGAVQTALTKAKIPQPPMEIIISAFKQTLFAYRMNRIKKTFESYFYGTLYAMLMQHKRREISLAPFYCAFTQEQEEEDWLKKMYGIV